MKLQWVYRILPVLVFYTDKLIPSNYGAKSYGPVVCIRQKYKDDYALLQHELTHSKQVYRTCFLMGFFYQFNKSARLQYEVEAYRVQLEHTPHHEYAAAIYTFSKYLATKYDLDISEEQALALLKAV